MHFKTKWSPVMGYRILIAGLSVVGLVLLFGFQLRLSSKLGRREDKAMHRDNEVEKGRDVT
ncbi:hypothetical protein [Cupriavidus pinatubonensis]|uniref:hypothetical protein n=1 Tax=Cupriavidus pinatubonensis TaxID=248026 RepID=UPI003620E2EA